jgi:peroxiredoxin
MATKYEESTMPQEGDVAPDFELSGVEAGEKQLYRLSDTIDDGNYVVLVFYPADFSPICTAEMCAIRDSSFFTFTDNVVVWGISGDSLYAHQAFADEYDLDFPLLADTDHSVASQYSSRYDEWEGQREITKRSVFLIGPNMQIKYVWRSEDAYVEPDLWPIKEALEAAMAEGMDSNQTPPDISPAEMPRKIDKLD